MHTIIKRISLIVAVIAALAAGYYFLYWQNTPAFAAGEIQQAVQKKDYPLFQKRVDMRRVYSAAVDDALAELSADGMVEHRLAASLMKGLKRQIVDELIRQTEINFKQDEPADASLLDQPVKTLTAYIGSSALSLTDVFAVTEKDGIAMASIKLHDKKLGKDFVWKVQMEKDPSGLWCATRVINLREYLKEREQLLKKAVTP
ncbi:MAG: hypothetical protein SPI25_01695 [Dialister sp.]|nr:hypothetical protein [Dialister sp.]